MLRLSQTNMKTTRCAIVFAHMTYDIQNGAEHGEIQWKICKKRSPLKPQDTQDYDLRLKLR